MLLVGSSDGSFAPGSFGSDCLRKRFGAEADCGRPKYKSASASHDMVGTVAAFDEGDWVGSLA